MVPRALRKGERYGFAIGRIEVKVVNGRPAISTSTCVPSRTNATGSWIRAADRPAAKSAREIKTRRSTFLGMSG